MLATIDDPRQNRSQMRILAIPLVLIPAIALAACQSKPETRSGVDQGQLATALAKEKIRFSKAKVGCSVNADGTVKTLPALVLRRGRSATTSLTAEGVYPTHFAFPEIGPAKMGDQFPITPANPTRFEAGEFGWTLELEAGAQQSFIMLRGTLTARQMGTRIRSGGIPFEPITTRARDAIGREVTVILSDNRAARPAVVTLEYPISIAAQPGESYRVYLDDAHEDYAEFRCEIVD